jgi:hypothetical protein
MKEMRKNRSKRSGRRRLTVPGTAVVGARVPIHVRKAVERIARDEGSTLSEVARHAIENYVGERELGDT